ncbi:MAG: hypothetical protein EOO44_07005, partial [Flavobacterium sp.]
MSSKLQYRFSQYEVQPPVEVWAGIASRLDVEYSANDSVLAEKIANSETPVPAGLWSKISDELDEVVITEEGSNKMPADNPIQSAGAEKHRTPVVPFTLRRVAAAAVIIVGIA